LQRIVSQSNTNLTASMARTRIEFHMWCVRGACGVKEGPGRGAGALRVFCATNRASVRPFQGSMPPSSQMIFHSSSVTGCTDSRMQVTSAISLSRGSFLTSASVT